MILKESFSIEHIMSLRKKRKIDPLLLERSIYAFGLLEALATVGMPFVFKGGTSLMLLLEKPRRLSTDIDITVKPGTDVVKYIDEASKLFPFTSMNEQIREGKNGIIKRHFKFYYDSPVNNKPLYILLDVVFDENHYSRLVTNRIENELLLTEGDNIEVVLPSVDCILGEKLTAFAPHTTGILLGHDKDLEIIKQLYDISCLTEVFDSFADIRETYEAACISEIGYRGINMHLEDVLRDTIESSACIGSRGGMYSQDYSDYLRGIHSIVNYIYSERFSGEMAASAACKVMHIAACVLRNEPFLRIEDPSIYVGKKIPDDNYKNLGSLMKTDLEAYAHVVKAIGLLSGK